MVPKNELLYRVNVPVIIYSVSFETMVFIIVRLFSRLFINFADYVNVYYFHVFTFSIA